MRRGRNGLLLGATLLAVATLAFWVGRVLGEREPATAGPPALPAGIENATPAPGETPDPTRPELLIKWVNQDAKLPRFDQRINGIEVGPTVQRRGGPCETQRPPVQVDFDQSRGTRVEISPRFLPAGATIRSTLAIMCGQEVAFAEVVYALPVADDLNERLARGESYWDIPRGGTIQIMRFIGEPAEASSIAAARWQAGSINGFPAAIGHPILDEGLGDAEVLVYAGGVLTVVRTGNLSIDTAIAIASGVVQ